MSFFLFFFLFDVAAIHFRTIAAKVSCKVKLFFLTKPCLKMATDLNFKTQWNGRETLFFLHHIMRKVLYKEFYEAEKS